MHIWPEYPWQVAPQQSLLPFVPAFKSKRNLYYCKVYPGLMKKNTQATSGLS
jgi:hypothetical protein